MPEVLKSLIKKKKDLISETKGEVIYAIKLFHYFYYYLLFIKSS